MKNKNSEIYNNDNIFYLKKGSEDFIISFDQIFKLKDLKEYNDFSLGAKKTFKNISHMIVEAYNEIFLDEGGRFREELTEEMQNILYIKTLRIVNDNFTFDDFMTHLKEITTDKLLKAISDFVEQEYNVGLDEMSAKSNQVNQELQFKDKHAKAILKISKLQKLMIPIISDYFLHNKSLFVGKDTDLTFEDAIANVFFELFEMYNDKSMALDRKIYKLVESRFTPTKFTDKKFWAAAKIRGMTPESETLETYRKLIVNGIPKLKDNSNVVTYFQSIIRNSIEFALQKKFRVKMQTINLSAIDRNDLSEYEKIEVQMLRKDEGFLTLRYLNIEDGIKRLEKKYGVENSKEIFLKIKDKVDRNLIQERLLQLFISKEFNDKNAIYHLTYEQYMRCLIILHKHLVDCNFKYLPRLLLSKVKALQEKVTINGKRVRPRIMTSKEFMNLVEKKYGYYEPVILKPILSIISTLYNNDFFDLDGKAIIGENVKVQDIAYDIINYITIM